MLVADGASNTLVRLNETLGRRNTFIRLGVIALLIAYATTIQFGFNEARRDWLDFTRYGLAQWHIKPAFGFANHAPTPNGRAPQKKYAIALNHLKEKTAKARQRLKDTKKKIVDRFTSRRDLPLPGVTLELPFD